MLLRTEVTQASDVELLTVILGRRQTAETLLKQAGSLFALLFLKRGTTTESCFARRVRAPTRPMQC